MEEGSLRCDANISLRPAGSEKFGTRVEIKNMNSFRAVENGLAYEVARHTEILDAGGQIVQETRRWDETKGVTYAMRSKEEADDYRYFPDPDLVPVIVESSWVEALRQSLPEMPDARQKKYVDKWGLPAYDAAVITASKHMADFFEAVMEKYDDAKIVSNWLMGEISRHLNAEGLEITDTKLTPDHLTALIKLQDEGTISGTIAKTVLKEMFESGKMPDEIVEEKGLIQITDEAAIAALVDEVIANNPKPVADYQSGNKKAIGFLVGQVMKLSKGKANPALVNKLLQEKL
jgi:aspartyl-tRNA(Asn)/glutamyl-tRNA(Gln) amidotransferase subunit B